MDWSGRTALITGGVSGIGFGIARALCAAGIRLVLTYRRDDYRAQAERWFAAQRWPMPRFLRLDVTDRQRWQQVAEEAGPVQILVNNAGVSVLARPTLPAMPTTTGSWASTSAASSTGW